MSITEFLPFLQFDPVPLGIIGASALAGGLLGKRKAKTTQVSTLSGEQQAVSSPLSQYLASRVGTGLPAYTDERVAQLGEIETQALGLLKDYMASTSALGGPTEGALTQLLSGQPSTEINPALSREYFQQAIAGPARATFEEETLPAIREGFIGPGLTFSTQRTDAEQRARRDLERSLLAEQSKLVYQDELSRRGLAETAAGRQLGAAGIAPTAARTLEEAPLRRAAAGTAIGALPRQIEQAELDVAFNEFIRTSPELSPVIQQAMQYLGLSSTGTFYEPGKTFGEGALQGGALASALMFA